MRSASLQLEQRDISTHHTHTRKHYDSGAYLRGGAIKIAGHCRYLKQESKVIWRRPHLGSIFAYSRPFVVGG